MSLSALKFMRRLFISILTLMLAASCFFTTAFAAEPDWVFGDNRFDPQAINVTQGYQGWYYLYSLSTNTGGSFPLDTLEECDQNPASGRWKVPDSAGVPDSAVDWFGIRNDGFFGVGEGVSVGLKWVVPEDGTYTMQFVYFGGTNNPNDISDGVIFYIYYNQSLMSSEETSGVDRLADEIRFKEEMTLKAGEEFYCIVDPKQNSSGDDAWWRVDITKHQETVSSSSTFNGSSDSSEVSSETATVSSDTAAESNDSEDNSILSEPNELIDNENDDAEAESNGLITALIIAVVALILIVAGVISAFLVFLNKKGLLIKKKADQSIELDENNKNSDE